jgi:V/A-type H+/Na+-transporting ATPase subunit K
MTIDATMLTLIGVAISAGFGAVGSSLGVGAAARSAAGLLSKQPEKFPQVLALSALASTQSLYGLLFGFIILIQAGMLGGTPSVEVTESVAFGYIMAALPVGLACIASGWQQGVVAGAGVKILAEKPQNLSQAIVLSALIESFAIFGLVISLLIVFVGIAG